MVGLARSAPFDMAIAAANLLVYLYWEELILIPSEPGREDRDRFIIDIPSAAPALYAVLARRGFFEREHLWHYRRLGAMLPALPEFGRTPGIDAPSLTVQPSAALAASLAEELAKRADKPRVVLLTSERQLASEDFIQEARRAGGAEIPNLLMIVVSRGDGKDPASASEGEGMKMLSQMGWSVRRANSEDFQSLEEGCASFDFTAGAPKALFVSASGDAGLSFLDHGQAENPHSLSMGELDQALEELEVKSNGR